MGTKRDNKTKLQKIFEEQTPTIKGKRGNEYNLVYCAWLELQVEKLCAGDTSIKESVLPISDVSKALIAFFKWRKGQQLTADTVNEIETFAKEYQSNL